LALEIRQAPDEQACGDWVPIILSDDSNYLIKMHAVLAMRICVRSYW